MTKIYWIYDYNLAKKYDIHQKKLIKILESGLIDYLQLRCKNNHLSNWASFLMKKIKNYSTKIIINDNVNLAKKLNADGVHLGGNDICPYQARKILSDKKIIGVTVKSLSEIKLLKNAPINYLGIGTIFQTKTKQGLIAQGVEILAEINKFTKQEYFAIGGINSCNINQLTKMGIKQVAIASCLFTAQDYLEELKNIKQILENEKS